MEITSVLYKFIPAILLIFLPWIVVRYIFATPSTQKMPYRQHAAYLYGAGLTWLAAFTIPNPSIFTQTDSFTMHTLGGVVATLLFAYVVKAYGITWQYWWQPIVAVYFFASGLGVLNELMEFLLAGLGLFIMDASDTWWDFAANTLGAYLAYLGLLWAAYVRKR